MFFYNFVTPEDGYKTKYPFRYTNGKIGDTVYLLIYDESHDDPYQIVTDTIVDVYDHAVNYQGKLKDSALYCYYIDRYNPGRSVSFGCEIFETYQEVEAFKNHVEQEWIESDIV